MIAFVRIVREVAVGPKLQRVMELVSRLPEEEQEAYATRWLHYLEWGVKGPTCRCEPGETLETFLGSALDRPLPTEAELAELRVSARTSPALAAALDLYESGGLDVGAILAMRSGCG